MKFVFFFKGVSTFIVAFIPLFVFSVIPDPVINSLSSFIFLLVSLIPLFERKFKTPLSDLRWSLFLSNSSRIFLYGVIILMLT